MPKRKIIRNTIELKKEIIEKHENGARVSELATNYGIAKSTISTFIKNKETIKAANVAKGAKVLTKQRSQALEEVEKLLLIWISQKQLAGDSISEGIICEKARYLHNDLVEKYPSTSSGGEKFKASRGWFEKFKKRSGIHSVVRHGEAASSNTEAAEQFATYFTNFVETEGFMPQQVFNCDETGLFWKKMPNRTYITQEEKGLPGHKPMKDRLTLLLCGNASGDFKVKPLLVYHSENPRIFKKNNIIKSKLPVMWRANNKAWLTRQFFIEWIKNVFAPSVKEYLEKNDLPLQCLLVMDNAPAHPPDLEDELVEEFDFIKVKFLPANTTPLIQPMDQQVISNFKKLYTKALFERCFEVTNETELTLRDFWRNHFNIFHCIGMIHKAWLQVTNRTLNSAWRKLWPDCVADFEGFDANEECFGVVNDIVALSRQIDMEVTNEDIEELVDNHNEELNTEELELLQRDRYKELVGEEKIDVLSTPLLKEICAKWDELRSLVQKYHPDGAVVHQSITQFNDKSMSHFKNLIKKRQKQISLDRFLVRR